MTFIGSGLNSFKVGTVHAEKVSHSLIAENQFKVLKVKLYHIHNNNKE